MSVEYLCSLCGQKLEFFSPPFTYQCSRCKVEYAKISHLVTNWGFAALARLNNGSAKSTSYLTREDLDEVLKERVERVIRLYYSPLASDRFREALQALAEPAPAKTNTEPTSENCTKYDQAPKSPDIGTTEAAMAQDSNLAGSVEPQPTCTWRLDERSTEIEVGDKVLWCGDSGYRLFARRENSLVIVPHEGNQHLHVVCAEHVALALNGKRPDQPDDVFEVLETGEHVVARKIDPPIPTCSESIIEGTRGEVWLRSSLRRVLCAKEAKP
jgi:hypothetical protein